MSVDVQPAGLERSRLELERYLLEREPDIPPYVAVLGLHDVIPQAPDPAPAPGRSVIPVYLHENTAVLGPPSTVDDPAPPCFHCVALRWQKLRPEQHRDVLELGREVRA